MLRKQLEVMEHYPLQMRMIIVDDGSPEPALPIVQEFSHGLRSRIDLYRITTDIAWNRGGARNLAAREATTDWIVHLDTDHILPADCAARLLAFGPGRGKWYRFERYRCGAADSTRKKDKLDPAAKFGKIHPHIDSYLCHQETYWKAGGYNEDFSGCLGGGSPFLAELTKIAQPLMLPSDIHLHVYTTDVIKDASVQTLSRDRDEFAKRKAAMRGKYKGSNPIRFSWVKEALF
jgi:glycosyltransferase involved in cell wall biosynthesis